MGVKVAIWGAGKMGQLHGEAYRKIGAAEISCVIETDEEKGKRFSEEFQCDWIRDVSELEPGCVDGIDICLPTWLHRCAIEQAARICKWVFCEKPICLDQEEYRAVCRVIQEKKIFLMVGQVLRFWNGYVKARELLRKGMIGTPRFVTCRRRQKMPDWSIGNWLTDNQKSGGILMDLSIHDVDYLYWILGLPQRVSCEIVRRETTTLHSLLTLQYPECSAVVIGSWGMPAAFHNGGLESELEIVGDQGMISYKGDPALWIVTDTGEERVELPPEDGYLQELMYFVDSIQYNRAPECCDVSSVEGTMRILWAAKKACSQNAILPVDCL